jgi:Mce-associated membrane protein
VSVEIDTAEEQDEGTEAEETKRQAGDDEVVEADETCKGDTVDAAEPADEVSEEDSGEDEDEDDDPEEVKPPARKWRINRSRVLAFGVLPVLVLLIAAACGYLHWRVDWIRGSEAARAESVSAAKDSTVAILSYQPDTVEKDLAAARERLTGKFKDSYMQLVHDVVIPGAKKGHISAIATIPAAASLSADPKHAVALVFVNQVVTVGNDAPTNTSSAVRVTLDKTGGRWLISAFDPI